MKKKALSLALALILCLGLTVPAFAGGGFDLVPLDPSQYSIQNGVLTIYEGVTTIGEAAFMDRSDLTSVIFPSSLIEIDSGAFYSCTGLTSFTIPDSVTGASIGCLAFYACENLTSVTIPNGVTNIESSAFDSCTSLTSITIPSNVTIIGGSMFNNCTSLTSVTIPSSVTSIEWYAFNNCKRLKDIYYGGTEAQWKAINIDSAGNDSLTSATIHYSSAATAQPQPPADLAYTSTQTVDVDGKPVEFQMYALKNANGNQTNYIKLRDLAQALNGTPAQFEVGWNSAVNVETGKAYTANGSEMTTPFSGDRAYEKSTAPTNVNGGAASLTAIVLKDDQGNGYTYYQLRDLGKAIGFNVSWSSARGVYVETDKPYAG